MENILFFVSSGLLFAMAMYLNSQDLSSEYN